jgi:hypothetical protein
MSEQILKAGMRKPMDIGIFSTSGVGIVGA